MGEASPSAPVPLCKLRDLPPHLQFNSHILTGYRPPMSTRSCLHSVSYLHNESFNIYSHFVTLAYFLLASRDYSSVWPSDYHSLVTAFIAVDLLCCTLPFILSIFYHTFMCHHSGEHTYKQLLKLDIFGVWLTCTFGPISNIYTALYCLEAWRHLYLLLYMMLSFVVLYYLLVVDCKQRRVVALTVQFVFRVFIHLIRLTPLASTYPEALKYYLIMDAVSAVGAVINALHIPERWAPGKLDYVFNGHSLMHMVAFVALAVGRQGFLLDMGWLNSGAVCS